MSRLRRVARETACMIPVWFAIGVGGFVLTLPFVLTDRLSGHATVGGVAVVFAVIFLVGLVVAFLIVLWVDWDMNRWGDDA